MSENKNINKVILINVFCTFLLQSIMFFTTPIFTRMLGTEQYGQYAIFNSWVSILTCTMGLRINSSLASGMHHFKSDYMGFRNNILLFSTLVAFIETIIIILLKNIIGYYLHFNGTIITLMALTAFFQYIIEFAQSVYVNEKKAGNNSILSLSITLSCVFLSILFINEWSTKQKYEGRIYGVFIPYMIIGLLIWFILFFQKPIKLKKEYCHFGFIVGFPVVFHLLSLNLLSQSDCIIMRFLNFSDSTIGIYSLFFSFSAVLSTILNALNISWVPFYYDDLDGADYSSIDKKCHNYIELFSVICFGFLCLCREISYLLADSSYWSGINLLPIFISIVYFNFMYQFPVNFEFYHKKTKLIATGTFMAAIINIILNVLFIPKLGMYGAAIATALSYLSLLVLHYRMVNSISKNLFHIKIKFFIPGLLFLGLGTFMFYFFKNFWIIRWLIAGCIGIYEIVKISKRKGFF